MVAKASYPLPLDSLAQSCLGEHDACPGSRALLGSLAEAAYKFGAGRAAGTRDSDGLDAER